MPTIDEYRRGDQRERKLLKAHWTSDDWKRLNEQKARDDDAWQEKCRKEALRMAQRGRV